MKLYLRPKPGETLRYLGLGSTRGDYFRRSISLTPKKGFDPQMVQIHAIDNPRAVRGVLGVYLLYENPRHVLDVTLETKVVPPFVAPKAVHIQAERISTIVSAEMLSETAYARTFEREFRERLIRHINAKAKGLGVIQNIAGADLRIRFHMEPVPDDPEHVRCSVTSSELYLAVVSSRTNAIDPRVHYQ